MIFYGWNKAKLWVFFISKTWILFLTLATHSIYFTPNLLNLYYVSKIPEKSFPSKVSFLKTGWEQCSTSEVMSCESKVIFRNFLIFLHTYQGLFWLQFPVYTYRIGTKIVYLIYWYGIKCCLISILKKTACIIGYINIESLVLCSCF